MDVVAAGAVVESTAVAEMPAASPSSPLALLRGKRAELDRRLHLDLAVPRWDELLGRRLWVRYRPGDPAVLTGAIDKREKAHAAAVAAGGNGDPLRMTRANADFLVAACVAVYDLALDEQPPEGDLPEGYPTFASPDLSEALGSPPSAVETVRKLYATDGDLLIAANELLEWSGKSIPKAGADFLAG